MTLHKRSAVTCDQTGCDATVIDDGPDARVIARHSGWVWTRRGRYVIDLCPAQS